MSERLGIAEAISIRDAGTKHAGRYDRSIRGARLGHALQPADARDPYDRDNRWSRSDGNDHDRRQAGPLACCSETHRDRAPTGDTEAMIFTLAAVAATPSSDVHGACSTISPSIRRTHASENWDPS